MFYTLGIHPFYHLPAPEALCFPLSNKEPGFVRMRSGTRARAEQGLIPLSGLDPRGCHCSDVAPIPQVRGPT